jgi:tetratricopeptide (TPR) repeat protein
MRIPTIAALASMVAVAAPLAAQSQPNQMVIQVMGAGGKWVSAQCEIKGGNFQTNTAVVSLKTATEGGFTSDKEGKTTVDTKKYMDLLGHARSASLDAIKSNPQSAAAWYYLGRSSLMLGDLRGADTAFTQLQKLSPDCAEEIKAFRQKAWLTLVTPSTKYLQNKQYDSALFVLRDANIIAQYYPQAYYNLAAAFANMKPPQYDSAIFYFKLSADKSAADSIQFAVMLKGSIQNSAYLYQAMKDYPNAVTYFRRYLKMLPADSSDNDAKRSLAVSLRAMGNTAEANALEDQFAAAGTLSNNELAVLGVRKFRENDYAGAADAFKKILITNPYDHDALSNMANCYLALKDPKNLLDASQRILAVDPLGRNNLKLLANSFQLAADTNHWLDVVTMLQAMTTEVTVTSFAPGKDGARFVGTALGSEGRNANDKVIPPTPLTLVFDFYDAKGAVVTSQEVLVPALAAGAKQEIAVDATGAGIISWKYRKK